jgi:hypothetical protein
VPHDRPSALFLVCQRIIGVESEYCNCNAGVRVLISSMSISKPLLTKKFSVIQGIAILVELL